MDANSQHSNNLTEEEMQILIQTVMESSTLFTLDEIRQNPHMVAEILGFDLITTNAVNSSQNSTISSISEGSANVEQILLVPSDQIVTDPVATDPVATDPVATDPVATDPVATEQTVTEQIVTKPDVTDTTDPVVTNPAVTDTIDQQIPNIKTKKQTRCGHPECRRKLKIYDFPCKCGIIFCSIHRFGTPLREHANIDTHSHYCIFDYKAEYRQRMEREMNKDGNNNKSFTYSSSSGGNMAH
jgi:hypothetical protein